MSENNYVNPENTYPFTHPDELEVVLDGPMGPEPYRIFTFDTLDRLGEYFENDKFPFSPNEGKNAYPGWNFLVRVNETYNGVAGRLILFFATDSEIESPSQPGQNVSFLLEIPVKDPYPDNPTASYLDGGLFDYDVELPPTAVPAATLAFHGVVRENTQNPNQSEPDVQSVDLEAAAAESSAPAAEAADTTSQETEAAVDPNDTSNPVGEKVDSANTALAADPTVEDTIRNAPESDPAEASALADEYSSLSTELAAGNLSLPRTQEISTRLNTISSTLPPSAASAAATISGAVGPVLNPGNIPGLEGLANQATSIAGGFIPDAAGALGNLTGALDFAKGASLSDLTGFTQSLGASLKETTALLGAGNLLDNLPDVNELFKFDPKALINSIDIGPVVDSISQLDFKSISESLSGGIMDVVDQGLATFGPVSRSFPSTPALSELSGGDSGFGYNGSRSTPSGAPVRQTATVTPEAEEGGPAPEAPDSYSKLIEVLERTLTQDWAVKSNDGSGQKPSEITEDPRGKDQVPPPPPGTNPLIMEAYRISGQATLTKDGTEGEYAWHTAFVNWVLSKAGLPIIVSMSAQAYYTYGNRVNHTNLNNLKARKGDLVIFNSKTGAKHIGFFWGFDKDAKTVQILGGNQAGTVKLSDFPFSLKDGDFYVTHIRRNWEVPAEVEAAGPEGELSSRLDGKDGELTTPNESAIGPTGSPSSRLDSKGATPESDPNLARVTFEEDGTATLPLDATPAESAAAKEELNKRARRKSDDAFFNPEELSDEEYDAIEVPKRLTPEERKARDAAAREKRKAAAERKRQQQAEDNAFYGGGAFSTSGGNTNRVVTTTQSTKTTTTGGGSTSYKSPPTKDDNGASAIKAAKGSFYRSLSSAQRKAASLKSKYGVTVTPYQPSGSNKWRLR